jgi:CheY-like chemotaxis protein
VGSDFWADLPLTQEAPAIQPTASSPLDAEIERSLNILAADDHPTNLRVVELILAAVGADVTTVANGAEAVSAFKVEAFDLVLMDMQMPVLDGLSAVQQIRAWEVEQGRAATPVLMLTANAMAEHRAASEKAGADGHVAKPVTSQALIDAINTVLEAHGGAGASEDRQGSMMAH